ncbi:MAG: LysE family translocator [Phycisphaerales bacterium]|nr:LysE family translocator [Phycisphaerales bacterium]
MDTQLTSFMVLAIVLTLIPGADTALVTKNTITRGKRAAIWTTLGIALGCAVHATASALGLSAILAHSAEAFHAVKTVGAAYLIWIGVKTLLDARKWAKSGDVDPGNAAIVVKCNYARSSFLEGLFTNLLNPKVAVFYLMVLPQFVRPGDPVLLRSLLLAGIHILFGVAWLSMYASFLNQLRHVLTRPSVKRKIESVTGLVLILFGLRLAWQRRS